LAAICCAVFCSNPGKSLLDTGKEQLLLHIFPRDDPVKTVLPTVFTSPAIPFSQPANITDEV
jgi:hypothetical protein